MAGSRSSSSFRPASRAPASWQPAMRARPARSACFMVTSGPGATNSVTPIRDCMADSVPVVLITGQVPRGALGTDAFQEAPVFNLMSTCAKHAFLVTDPEELEATMRTAFEIARSGRPGPVVVDIPKDVQNWMGAVQGQGHAHTARLRPAHARNSELACHAGTRQSILRSAGSQRTAATLCRRRRHQFRCCDELRQFSTTFGIPVVTTLMGLGAMDSADPLSLHMLGMHGAAYANYAVEDCDFLIAVASRFDDRVAGKPKEFAPRCARNRAHRYRCGRTRQGEGGELGACGDAKTALADLLAAGNGFTKDFSAWRAHLDRLQEGASAQLRSDERVDSAAVRAGMPERDRPRRCHLHHRRRPASDVGGPVSRLPRTRVRS